MWTRQVETKEQAVREMAVHSAKGKRVVGPVPAISPNGRPVWAFSVEA